MPSVKRYENSNSLREFFRLEIVFITSIYEVYQIPARA